ncbi:hypothetical protein ABZP36_012650 [Zizania latifolia]
MGSPEMLLNGFVRLVAVLERLGNALGTLAFTWGTVILLGGYPKDLDSDSDFPFATIIVFLEAIRMVRDANRQNYQLFFSTRGAFRPLGLNGMLTAMVYFSAVLLILRNYYFIHAGNALLRLTIPAAVVRVVLASTRLPQLEAEKIYGSDRNLKKSLKIFYGMVLVQGILYIVACLLEVFFRIPEKFMRGEFRGRLGVENVNHYYVYALEKCMGGTMFAPKRISPITFAMDSIESDSSKNRICGVQVLHSLLNMEQLRDRTISELTTSTKTVVSLFSMLAWTSHGDAEIRLFAAKVAAELAGSLRIVHIPGAMQLVASLLDTEHHHQPKTRQHFLLNDIQGAQEQCPTTQQGEHYSIPDEQSSCLHRFWKWMTKLGLIPGEEPSTDKDWLPVQGLLILEGLANFDATNCMEISRATGLISKIIDFTSDRNYLASINNQAKEILIEAADLSLRVLRRLASTKGKSGVTLRQRILEHPFILSNLANILDDSSRKPVAEITQGAPASETKWSSPEFRVLATEILKHLAMERNASENIGRIPVIISSLMHEFLSGGGASSSTNPTHLLGKISGQALAILAMESDDNCSVMLKEPGYEFIRELTTMIRDNNYMYTAASLLGNMCHTHNSKIPTTAKLSPSDLNDLCDTLPKVLEGIEVAEGAELEVLIGLSSQICKAIPEDFARKRDDGQIKERFVERLVAVLNANMRPNAHCAGIRRVIVEHAIHLMECNNSLYANDFHKWQMFEALSKVESTPSMAENYRLLSGDAGLMEHTTPLDSLVDIAKKLMKRE